MKSPDASPPVQTPVKAPATTQPILYHRTGGIAGTDDRVVIWTDGLVQVDGKLLLQGNVRVPKDRFDHLIGMFDGWEKLNDRYLYAGVVDAYTITINYGSKSVEATDLAPDLPAQFRQIFVEIEAIAGQAAGAADEKPAP
jgi:hypothetical protein